MGILTRAGAGWRGTALLAGTALALITVTLPAGTAVASSQLWKIQKTANHTVPNGTAGAVSCPSAGACEAVGAYRNTSGVTAPLAESWNGTAWTLQAAPIPAGANTSGLDAVSCTAAASCEAVGSQAGSSGTTALAEAWNGTAWTVQSIPGPAGGTAVSLTGISCASADDCEAVGNYNSSTVPAILAERWNGTSWSIQVIPDPGGPVTPLLARCRARRPVIARRSVPTAWGRSPRCGTGPAGAPSPLRPPPGSTLLSWRRSRARRRVSARPSGSA